VSYKRYPIFLDLRKKVVLVVGGGNIALQKVKELIKTESNIHIVAKEIDPKFYQLELLNSALKIEKRAIIDADIVDVDLLIVATSDAALNKHLVSIARSRNIWANSVDDVSNCDFYTSSTIDHGNFRFAISSDGMFPGLTRTLRKLITDLLPNTNIPLLENIALARSKLKSQLPDAETRMNILRGIIAQLEETYFKDKELVGGEKTWQTSVK
jgi:precorrin-2 dehydrogenase/sirohydrochlorin ferrochelatase